MPQTLSILYFPAAVALGALHALEPGHAKALTAAYLIGIKGTKRDSIVLGLSVATTHSLVVIAISAMGLWIGNEAFAGEATHWLERASGLIAILIGSWMLYRRLGISKKTIHAHRHVRRLPILPISRNTHFDAKTIRFLKAEQEVEHHHAGHEDHTHLDDEAHAAAHSATLPSYVNNGIRPSLGQIMAFGAAGGMIPCPASITVMLLALSSGKAGLGIFTVIGFSLGLALALVGVGMIVVTGLSKLQNTGRLHWISKKAPILSALLVIFSGLFALFIAH